ncbi:MBL fold metallo-hydrolase [Paenibacillus arenilitoris]|uniref:MBL fold metallo-hydrolase n=1 Tax=Paenibacillus arenilitoris TaxID=2772299 RepID=A0A927CQV9_9BACL|nr:MBL fold metallo-hydrolase [Paenibacillus arenilitoris]MBD2872094.1 MBL fold metallo-hydrolase [Paenibacillus arenilitoris]
MPLTSASSGEGLAYRPDIYCYPIQIVNVCFIGDPNREEDGWVLVDAGMPRSAKKIIKEAEQRFRSGPKAIILTHGHFDHVGAIVELIEHWNVPAYAHKLELPYLTGEADYPPADPTVDGGLVTEMSPFFPHDGIDLGDRVHPLPKDGGVPGLTGWKYIHTPGHTPGHISLYRGTDGTLIAGDAFVTVKQESLYKVIMQEQEISGPPKYFTTDWKQAEQSVKTLAALQPYLAITGHGEPMFGESLKANLKLLTEKFQEIAVPEHGRYVDGIVH